MKIIHILVGYAIVLFLLLAILVVGLISLAKDDDAEARAVKANVIEPITKEMGENLFDYSFEYRKNYDEKGKPRYHIYLYYTLIEDNQLIKYCDEYIAVVDSYHYQYEKC